MGAQFLHLACQGGDGYPYCPPVSCATVYTQNMHTGAQARNQFGTPGGAKSFPRGTQIF